jgi:hypothetical protein
MNECCRQVDTSSYEMVEYLNQLREGIFDAFSGTLRAAALYSRDCAATSAVLPLEPIVLARAAETASEYPRVGRREGTLSTRGQAGGRVPSVPEGRQAGGYPQYPRAGRREGTLSTRGQAGGRVPSVPEGRQAGGYPQYPRAGRREGTLSARGQAGGMVPSVPEGRQAGGYPQYHSALQRPADAV